MSTNEVKAIREKFTVEIIADQLAVQLCISEDPEDGSEPYSSGARLTPDAARELAMFLTDAADRCDALEDDDE